MWEVTFGWWQEDKGQPSGVSLWKLKSSIMALGLLRPDVFNSADLWKQTTSKSCARNYSDRIKEHTHILNGAHPDTAHLSTQAHTLSPTQHTWVHKLAHSPRQNTLEYTSLHTHTLSPTQHTWVHKLAHSHTLPDTEHLSTQARTLTQSPRHSTLEYTSSHTHTLAVSFIHTLPFSSSVR